ncbi:MAG: PEGA domain-containing protein, partial [Bradymonadaceae bacterium]
MKCLAKQPEHRFASMQSLVRLLKSCSSGLGGTSHPLEAEPIFSSAPRMALPIKGDATSDSFETVETGTGPRHVTSEHTVEDIPSKMEEAKPADLSPSLAHAQVEAPVRSGSPSWLPLAVIAGGILVVLIATALYLSQPPSTTAWTISSHPPDTFVYLDNRLLGKTPFTVDLEAGPEDKLVFKHDGYEDFIVDIAHVSGPTMNAHAVLPPLVEAEEEIPHAEAPAAPEEVVEEEPPDVKAKVDSKATVKKKRPKTTRPSEPPPQGIKLDR